MITGTKLKTTEIGVIDIKKRTGEEASHQGIHQKNLCLRTRDMRNQINA